MYDDRAARASPQRRRLLQGRLPSLAQHPCGNRLREHATTARETRFAFDLPHEAPVRLEVFDLNGRRVADVVSGVQPAGHHEAPWHAADGRGGRLAAGLYFARFVTPGLAESRRLVLLP